jgi:uncharacterized membrane protein
MPKSRVESFSDCVIAFAITLLILDIHLEDAGANIDNAGMIQALLALLSARVWLSSWTLNLKLREQPSAAGEVLIL